MIHIIARLVRVRSIVHYVLGRTYMVRYPLVMFVCIPVSGVNEIIHHPVPFTLFGTLVIGGYSEHHTMIRDRPDRGPNEERKEGRKEIFILANYTLKSWHLQY